MKTLETKRLLLRNFKEDDLDDLYEYVSVDGVGEKAGWPHHTDIKMTKELLNHYIEKDVVYAIVHKENQKVIGSIGLYNREPDENKPKIIQKEIGFVLNKEYWGQGLMPEAVKAVIQYAFEEIKVDVLTCSHYVHNVQSRRVIEKSGFHYYKDAIMEAKRLAKTYEGKIYKLSRQEYERSLK